METRRQAPFLDVAWEEIDATRYPTLPSRPRTLRAVAEQIRNEFGSFAELVASEPRPGLDPGWYEPCAQIECEAFDRARWAKPWLVPAVESERRHCASTRYCVWEGVHSILVLAVGVVST